MEKPDPPLYTRTLTIQPTLMATWFRYFCSCLLSRFPSSATVIPCINGHSLSSLQSSSSSSFSFLGINGSARMKSMEKPPSLRCRASSNDDAQEENSLIPSPSDEWFKQGKIVKAHPVGGSGGKAKDPIFGLTMGATSQAPPGFFS